MLEQVQYAQVKATAMIIYLDLGSAHEAAGLYVEPQPITSTHSRMLISCAAKMNTIAVEA